MASRFRRAAQCRFWLRAPCGAASVITCNVHPQILMTSSGTLTYAPLIATQSLHCASKSAFDLRPPYSTPRAATSAEACIMNMLTDFDFDFPSRPGPDCRKCDSNQEQLGTKSFPPIHMRSDPGATSLQEGTEEAPEQRTSEQIWDSMWTTHASVGVLLQYSYRVSDAALPFAFTTHASLCVIGSKNVSCQHALVLPASDM